MARKTLPTFDSRAFLARVGNGRSIGNYAAGQAVFSQGDPADAVFYVQKGKVKITVISTQGKEAVVAFPACHPPPAEVSLIEVIQP